MHITSAGLLVYEVCDIIVLVVLYFLELTAQVSSVHIYELVLYNTNYCRNPTHYITCSSMYREGTC